MTTINRITDADLMIFKDELTLDKYQEIAGKSAIYPGKGTMLGISYCAHKLAGEAGEFNEHFGKAQRDDGLFDTQEQWLPEDERGKYKAYHLVIYPLTPERGGALLKELGDVLWYVAALANELDFTLGEVSLMNLQKLKDRTDRNALQGSGDNR